MSIESDPRFQRSRDAIVAAARELLLAHGPAAVTHQRIAAHAGIGRATVYRHWPRTDQLLAEAMATVPMPFFERPTSPYRDWLRSELGSLADQLELFDVRAVATTLAGVALWDADMEGRRAGFARALSQRLVAALEEAERLGELELRTDASSAAALVVGPLYYRATIEGEPADAALLDQCVRSVGAWRDA